MSMNKFGTPCQTQTLSKGEVGAEDSAIRHVNIAHLVLPLSHQHSKVKINKGPVLKMNTLYHTLFFNKKSSLNVQCLIFSLTGHWKWTRSASTSLGMNMRYNSYVSNGCVLTLLGRYYEGGCLDDPSSVIKCDNPAAVW